MRELSLQAILKTAGFKYEEITALMHKTGFFQDKVDDPLSSSIEQLVEANVSKFERETFWNKDTDLKSLMINVNDYIKAWIKEQSITQEQLFNCVMANYFTAADVISATQDNTKCLLTLREKFNGDVDKFASEIHRQCGIQRS